MTIETKDSMQVLHEQLAQATHNRAAHAAPATPIEEAHHHNSTDATRGEPLVQRAQKRRAELAVRLAILPDDDVRTRIDIDTAIATVDDLLTGDVAHLSDMTAVAISRWLETNKHLAELASDGGS